MKKIILLSVFVCIMSSLFGFDGNRKGFLLGFGAGLSQVSFYQEAEAGEQSMKSDTMDEIGFVTDFKIGYGLNNRFELYYSNKVAWFTMESSIDDVIIADGISVIGGSYFLSSELNDNTWHPSAFISAGLGFSSWSAPLEDDSDAMKGVGFFLGAGYEATKHLRISLEYFGNNPSITSNGLTITTYSNAIMLTINGMYF